MNARRLAAALAAFPLAGPLLCAALPAAAHAQPVPAPRSRVSYDARSFLIDGKPVLIWSGEFHPFRLPSPDLWRDVLQKMKATGFNAVSIYFDWGYHTAKRGQYDFTGIRDMDRVLRMAEEEGLYVIARTGPYVNGELTRGGFPGWLTNIKGAARSDAPDYLAAADEWLGQIDPILARHQIGRVKQGGVILYQIENELSATAPTQVRYMRHLYDKVRGDGIIVPIFHNDPGRHGRWVPAGAGVPGTNEGPNELYGFDGYPGGPCNVRNERTHPNVAPDWGLYGSGGATGGASASPRTPGMIAEFGGGWFDYWGSNGSYTCNAERQGPAYERVFYGSNIANGIALQNVYMAFGGTNWGWLPAPVNYTSYDYGAMFAEDRALRPKALAMKQIGGLIAAVPDLARLEKAAPVMVSSPTVRVLHDRNPITDARLLFVTHQPNNGAGDDTVTITADLPDGHYAFPVRLTGYDAKLLVGGVTLGRQRLVYSTSQVQATLARGADDVALLWGHAGEPGETVLRYAAQPRVEVLAGDVRPTWDAARHDLRLDYVHAGIARVRITGAAAPVTLLIAEEGEAQRFFRIGDALVRGPALVRHQQASSGTLALTGDTEAPAPLEVWAPPGITRLRWNGAAIATRAAPGGSLIATAPLAGPVPVSVPDLSRARWRTAAGSPEARPDYDDSGWATVGAMPDASTIKPPYGQPTMQMDAYGFHHGDVWYRGRFAGGADARALTLHYGGGGAGLFQLWLDGRFVTQHELPNGLADPITVGKVDVPLPAAAQAPGEHVLAVMVRNGSHNEDLAADDTFKEPRGLISVSLGRPDGAIYAVPIAWRIQGNAGGETLRDPARGPLNEGGLDGERRGWHLPGFDDTRWAGASVPAAAPVAGTAWYRTSFDLAVPPGQDASFALQFGDPAVPRSPGRYRVLIFVNGWNMGQFAANVGPQRGFVLPEGVLNHHGRNTLALAVTSDGAPGDGLEAVRLVATRTVRGGVPVHANDAPGYAALIH